MKSLKIAFGVITRNVKVDYPFLNFINNAQTYEHSITSIIFGYKDFVDKNIVAQLNNYCEVMPIHLSEKQGLAEQLSKFSLSETDISALLGTPHLKNYNMVSYGTARNYVLLSAILAGVDILIFFDTDVYPQVLYDEGKRQFHYEEVDFVGEHIKVLNANPKAVATTSDYTGFYIIPHMNFPHLKELLFGVQKEDSFSFISKHNKLALKHSHKKELHPTQKVLGGNLAIDLRKIHYLSPFFSETLIMQDECFLGRGEDTTFGPLINLYGGECIDIDLPIFHNCFGDFPKEPEIGKKQNLDRFFYACMGWIIRNPFYNWLHAEYIHDFPAIDKEKRLEALKIGSFAANDYFKDKRFLMLPKAFEMANEQLEQTKTKFFQLQEAWEKFKKKM